MKIKKPFDGEIYRRSQKAIIHGALTNSKRPESFVQGVYPTHLTHGLGAHVFDTKGNRYIDFIAGLGSNLFGYANQDINEAIIKQASKGTSLSLGTTLEVETAERIKEFFPFIDKIRFVKTGSEACTAACIMARAIKGKRNAFLRCAENILSEGYHGWHPEFQSLNPPHYGVTNHLHIKKLAHGDPDTYDAGLIIEPVITDSSEQRFEYLKKLKIQCNETDTMLIFDETITGLRYQNHSVAASCGITPDIIILGKAIASGMPLSVIGLTKETDQEFFVSSTFAGETLSLAACNKTLWLLKNKFDINYLWEKGADFYAKFNALGADCIRLEGYPTRGRFVGTDLNRALFFQEACKAGILLGPSFFLTFAAIEYLDDVLNTFSDIFLKIKTGSVELEGQLPKSPYAEKVRENL